MFSRALAIIVGVAADAVGCPDVEVATDDAFGVEAVFARAGELRGEKDFASVIGEQELRADFF